MAEEANAEIAELRAQLRRIESRLAELERGTVGLEADPSEPELVALPQEAAPRPLALLTAAPPPGRIHGAARPAPPPPATFAPLPPSNDIEAWLGARWLSALGILVVVLGVAFLIFYTIENQWISLTAQIVLGVVGGVALVAAGEGLHRAGRFGAYPYFLVAGGLAISYFSIYASYAYPAYEQATGMTLFADSFLLAATAAGVVGFGFRYRHPVLAGEGFALGFITALIGPSALGATDDVRVLGLAYVVLFAGGVLVAVARFGWALVGLLGGLAAWSVLAILRLGLSDAPYPFAAAVVVLGVELWATAIQAARKASSFPTPIESREAGSTWVGTATIASAGAGLLLWWNFAQAMPGSESWILGALALLHFAIFAAPVDPKLRATAGTAGVALAYLATFEAWAGTTLTVAWSALTAGLAMVVFLPNSPLGRNRAARSVGYAAGAVLAVWVYAHDVPVLSSASPAGSDAVLATLAATVALGVLYVAARSSSNSNDDRTLVALALAAAVAIPLPYLQASLQGYQVSLAWAAEGVALVLAGFAAKARDLRVAGIGILLLVVARVLLVDSETLDLGLRVVVFLTVGALVLVVAFLFSRSTGQAAGRPLSSTPSAPSAAPSNTLPPPGRRP